MEHLKLSTNTDNQKNDEINDQNNNRLSIKDLKPLKASSHNTIKQTKIKNKGSLKFSISKIDDEITSIKNIDMYVNKLNDEEVKILLKKCSTYQAFKLSELDEIEENLDLYEESRKMIKKNIIHPKSQINTRSLIDNQNNNDSYNNNTINYNENNNNYINYNKTNTINTDVNYNNENITTNNKNNKNLIIKNNLDFHKIAYSSIGKNKEKKYSKLFKPNKLNELKSIKEYKKISHIICNHNANSLNIGQLLSNNAMKNDDGKGLIKQKFNGTKERRFCTNVNNNIYNMNNMNNINNINNKNMNYININDNTNENNNIIDNNNNNNNSNNAIDKNNNRNRSRKRINKKENINNEPAYDPLVIKKEYDKKIEELSINYKKDLEEGLKLLKYKFDCESKKIIEDGQTAERKLEKDIMELREKCEKKQRNTNLISNKEHEKKLNFIIKKYIEQIEDNNLEIFKINNELKNYNENHYTNNFDSNNNNNNTEDLRNSKEDKNDSIYNITSYNSNIKNSKKTFYGSSSKSTFNEHKIPAPCLNFKNVSDKNFGKEIDDFIQTIKYLTKGGDCALNKIKMNKINLIRDKRYNSISINKTNEFLPNKNILNFKNNLNITEDVKIFNNLLNDNTPINIMPNIVCNSNSYVFIDRKN